MEKILAKLNELLDAAKRSPFYPDRKIIRGAVAGAVTAVVAAVGLSASPLVGAIAVLVIAEATAYLTKPAARDVRKRLEKSSGRAVIDRDKVKV